jgi:dipeptidyl aminopeptidase/acylaminoacyl peptidase
VLIRDAQTPAWSPDGERLAFASIRDRNGKVCSSDQCSFPGELYTAAADGGDLRRLTENEGDDAGPRWSPDGSRILFSSDRNKPAYGSYWPPSEEVYSVASDGSCLTWLTNGTPESSSPAWRAGSGTRFDPGDCDPTARPVRIDPPRLPRTRGLWLGTRFRGLLLADASRWTTTRYLSYADCAAFTGCPQTIGLSSGPACTRLRQRSLPRNPRHRFRMRGALVLLDRPSGVAYVLSGPTVTTVRLERRTTLDAVRPIVRELRPYRASSARKRLAPPRDCRS